VGTGLRFERPDGSWGALVDLRGPKGGRGDRGAGGGSGGGWPALNLLPMASDELPDEFVVQQSGRWVRASLVQMMAWFADDGGISPVFTYANGLVSRIDYADGSFKTFSRSANGDVAWIDLTRAGTTTRKTFNRDANGVLVSIVQTVV
jgi:hypothetical protein